MTHVFVAPHPDDVALSCGGLIASLRELGQTVTILTVFSGDGDGRPDDPVPARGARVRVQGDVAGDRGVQPQRHPRRLADRRPRPRLGRHERPPRCHPVRRRPGRQAVLAALVVVPPGEHPQRVAGRPARRRRHPDAGRRLHRRAHGCRGGRRPDGPTPARGRAVRLLRRGVDRLPRPARCRLPRLRGRRRAARDAPRRRRRAVRDPAPRDRAARAAEGLPAARRRWPRRPPAVPRGRGPAPPGGPPLGHARPGLRRHRHVLRGLPVRVVERLPPARATCPVRLSMPCPPISA